MIYIRVKWKQVDPDYPVLMYSEIDDQGWEVRKVEVFADGRCGAASREESVSGAFLGKVPIPPLAEIALDPQFDPVEISAEEFEEAWAKRLDWQQGRSH